MLTYQALLQVINTYRKHAWYRSERLSLRTMNSVSNACQYLYIGGSQFVHGWHGDICLQASH